MRKEDIYNKVVEYITEEQNRFYRVAYSHTNDREASLDIVQNAVCRALEKYGFAYCGIIHIFNGDERIAFHKCI